MPSMIHYKKRTRIFIGGEGDSERSFIKWLQYHADHQQLNLHLDCEPLSGGGYEMMLRTMLQARERRDRKTAKKSILLVDTDRAELGHDTWSLDRLEKEAQKKNIFVCKQRPKIEATFLRMFLKNERRQLDPAAVEKELLKLWPEYRKPMDAETLKLKFTWNDLMRLANVNSDVKDLLNLLGFFW